jgi:glyoxylase-like metal-dependent hydrolase (beta-lactamase superfamily II)
MKLLSIDSGSFQCDGGALFGVIPKVLWNKGYPVSESNFVKLALRCLLADTGTRRILIDAGIGNHFPEKFLQNNGVDLTTGIVTSLNKKGYSADEITDVVFTHLHWDHCTGAVQNENGNLRLTFQNATHWCSSKQWVNSMASNRRESAAYFRPVLDYLNNSGCLRIIDNEGEFLPGIDFRFYDGHTPGQLIPFIKTLNKTVVYMADLIPTSVNIPLLWIAAYDLFPVKVMEEKETFLETAASQGYVLFFEHDFYNECAVVGKNEKSFFSQRNGSLELFI